MMTTHEDTASPAPRRMSRLFCPRCQDLIIAATGSQHVSCSEVRHFWACETCGQEFLTTVRWVAQDDDDDDDGGDDADGGPVQ